MNKTKIIHIYDTNAFFARVYKKAASDGALEKPESFIDGKPVFALKSTIGNIINQCKSVRYLLQSKPDYEIFAIDGLGESFRKKLSPDYKANRPPKDEEYLFQEKLLPHYIRRSGRAVISKDDAEADDCIGTLVDKLTTSRFNEFFKIVIFTKDKDMFQLCKPNVVIFDGERLYDNIGAQDKFGIPSFRISQMLALTGDSADNFAGIKGIGAKSATTILSQFDLSEVIMHPEILLGIDMRGKKNIYKNFVEQADKLNMMLKLASLKCDIDLNFNLNMCKTCEDDWMDVNELIKSDLISGT